MTTHDPQHEDLCPRCEATLRRPGEPHTCEVTARKFAELHGYVLSHARDKLRKMWLAGLMDRREEEVPYENTVVTRGKNLRYVYIYKENQDVDVDS